jgi:hypothetical protein
VIGTKETGQRGVVVAPHIQVSVAVQVNLKAFAGNEIAVVWGYPRPQVPLHSAKRTEKGSVQKVGEI